MAPGLRARNKTTNGEAQLLGFTFAGGFGAPFRGLKNCVANRGNCFCNLMFCCTQRTCERHVASTCAAHCVCVCCRERIADTRVWTLTSCRFVSNCAVSARQWLKGHADENNTRGGQATATRRVRAIVCVVGKAVLHVPSVRKASMSSYFACVTTES